MLDKTPSDDKKREQARERQRKYMARLKGNGVTDAISGVTKAPGAEKAESLVPNGSSTEKSEEADIFRLPHGEEDDSYQLNFESPMDELERPTESPVLQSEVPSRPDLKESEPVALAPTIAAPA